MKSKKYNYDYYGWYDYNDLEEEFWSDYDEY